MYHNHSRQQALNTLLHWVLAATAFVPQKQMSKNTRTFVVSQSLKDQNATNWFYFDLVFLTERTGSTLGRWSQPITYWSPIRAIIPGSPILYHLMPRSNDNATLGTLFASQYDYVILCVNSCTCWRPQNNIHCRPKSVYFHKSPKVLQSIPKCSQNAHLNPEYVGLLGFNSHRQMIPALQARTVTPRSTSTSAHDLVMHGQKSSGDTTSFTRILCMSRSVPQTRDLFDR